MPLRSRSSIRGWHLGLLEVFDDCPFTLEDLPYLEVEVSYTVDRILSDQPFSLTFTVEKSSGWKLPLDDVLELDGLTLHPAELRLSALDLQVYFQDEAEAAFSLYRDGTAPVLHLANGTDITTTWHGADIWTLLCLWCHSKPLMPTAIGCSSTPHRWFPSPLEIWRSPWSTDLFPSPKTARPV